MHDYKKGIQKQYKHYKKAEKKESNPMVRRASHRRCCGNCGGCSPYHGLRGICDLPVCDQKEETARPARR